MFGPVMAGERIRLEPPRPEYAPAYIRWFADRLVTRYLMVRYPTSLRKQEEWIEQMETGEPRLKELRAKAADERIEHVGRELRALMHREAPAAGSPLG